MNLEKDQKEFTKNETLQNKKFFLYENVIGFISCASFLTLAFVSAFTEELPVWARVVLFLIGLFLFILGGSFCIKIETETGKYECQNCHHRYVPKYSSIYLAPHLGRTRYMTCPKCHKKSWQKKII